MKYVAFWESSRPKAIKVKCQLCGNRVDDAYPLDCLLRNEYWINTSWFCRAHIIEEFNKWVKEHYDIVLGGVIQPRIDDCVVREFQRFFAGELKW